MKKFLWGLMLSSVLSSYAPSISKADEQEHQGDKSGKILHFGNMGGVMPDLSPEDVPAPDTAGAKLLFQYCGQCHNVPGPGMRTAKQWSQTYWRMYWRMHLMVSQATGYRAPDYNQGMVIINYLNKYAMQSVRGNDVDRTETGAKEYLQTCNQCHELPNPTLHKATEWEDTITRMQGHIASMGKIAPDVSETEAILGYLTKHAKK